MNLKTLPFFSLIKVKNAIVFFIVFSVFFLLFGATSAFAIELTIGGDFSVQNRNYNGDVNMMIEQNNLTLVGVEGEDVVSILLATAELEDKNVGEDKVVSITNVILVGEDAGKYTVSYLNAPTTTVTISQALVSVSADNKTKIQGNVDPEFTFQIITGGLLGGDTFTGQLSRDPGNGVGTYNITRGTLSVDDGNNGDNYNFIFQTGTLTINRRPSSQSRSVSTSVISRFENLVNIGNTQTAQNLKNQWAHLFDDVSSEEVSVVFSERAQTQGDFEVRDLKINMTGFDVRNLQILLNKNNFIVANSGAGSPGNETSFFGPATQRALQNYQQAHNISPASGYFGQITRGHMKSIGLDGLWW